MKIAIYRGGNYFMTITKKDISDYLDEKGFKHSLIGFDYIIVAILYCIENPRYKYLTCSLYEVIANQFNVTAARVQRNIHQSILTSNVQEKNGEFIALSIDHFLFSTFSEKLSSDPED